MNVEFDTWFSERAMVDTGAIDVTLADLRERGVVYDEDGAVWLRSTDFGDDKDRVLVKSDGEYTYLLPDIAYHRDKFARGFDLLVNVWGADHHGYVPRMRAAVQALGHDPDDLEVVITQLVRLEKDGEEVKISKRSGNLITLEDLLDEVGVDAVRLTYLLQSVDSPQTVDLDLIVAQSNENPVFYVQMANARIRSIARVAAERGIDRRPLDEVDLSVLVTSASSRSCASCSCCPRSSSWPPGNAPRTRSRPGCGSSPAPCTASTTTARSSRRTPPRTCARRAGGSMEAAGTGCASASDLLGVDAPERM
jgi:arginyl-tRNA synthetase